MKKSVSKRIKLTGTGKLLRRPMAIDHFRSKKSSTKIRLKRNYRSFPSGYQKKVEGYLTVANKF